MLTGTQHPETWLGSRLGARCKWQLWRQQDARASACPLLCLVKGAGAQPRGAAFSPSQDCLEGVRRGLGAPSASPGGGCTLLTHFTILLGNQDPAGTTVLIQARAVLPPACELLQTDQVPTPDTPRLRCKVPLGPPALPVSAKPPPDQISSTSTQSVCSSPDSA